MTGVGAGMTGWLWIAAFAAMTGVGDGMTGGGGWDDGGGDASGGEVSGILRWLGDYI